MNQKNIYVASVVLALLSVSGCFISSTKQEEKKEDAVVEKTPEQLEKELKELEEQYARQEKHVKNGHGQGHMYKELDKKVFNTLDERKELFSQLGIEYTDHVLIGYKPLFRMDMKDCERYEQGPSYYDELAERYAKYVENRYCAPISVRWLGKDVGYGVFALKDLEEDEFIEEYTGEIVEKEWFVNGDYAWGFPLKSLQGNKLILDAKFKGNEMRFVNDSRDPNCIVKYLIGYDSIWHVCYIAKRPIKKGEQILVSYGANYWESRSYSYKEMSSSAE